MELGSQRPELSSQELAQGHHGLVLPFGALLDRAGPLVQCPLYWCDVSGYVGGGFGKPLRSGSH
jgi:hypothetical protein